MSSGASGAFSNAAGAISSGASGASSNEASARLPSASNASSSVPLKSPASPQPAVLVHPVVVTQPADTPPAAAATPHAAVAAPHSTVVSQLAAVPRASADVQPAFTPQRASTTLLTGEEPATVEKPVKPETLQSSHRRKSLAKPRPIKRAASKPEASASREESLPAEQSAAARPSKGPRLAEFNYACSRSPDSLPPLRTATPPQPLRAQPFQLLRASRKNVPRLRPCRTHLAPDSRTLRASRRRRLQPLRPKRTMKTTMLS